ncbi:MAG: DUF1015 domain-containing protein [Oscillospiraceae bacterium]
MEQLFKRGDLLLPADGDKTKWSVVACDQFTSQPEYWDSLDALVGEAPSTLRLMLPEAYLDSRDQAAETEKINKTMERYLAGGVFREVNDSYVYLERSLAGGGVRRGIVGVLDLEAYDYAKDSASPIRATEGTVPERLPPRVRVRQGAALEMPHIMVFIDDPKNAVIGGAEKGKGTLEKLYDFDLNGGGGHLRGWRLCGESADALDKALAAYAGEMREKYAPAAPVLYAMGDGNHSLATAKLCWERLKPSLSEEEKMTHPARFSLVEIVNIHDEAVTFEPIHRVLFDTDAEGFFAAAEAHFAAISKSQERGHSIRLVTAAGERTLSVGGLTIGELIGSAESFCQDYAAARGGKIDYIHNDDTALAMGRRDGCAALLLPKMEKDELFPSIVRSGPFPKKSFSIGHAEDKRYYLECRKIK